MAKTSKIENEKRIFTIQGWIIDSVPTALIVKQIENNGWCKGRQAYRLLAKARDEWIKAPEAELEEKRKLKIVQLEHLKRSLKENYKGTPSGIRAVMDVEKTIIQLEGLKPAQEHIIKGSKESPLQVESKTAVEIDYSKLADETLIDLLSAVTKGSKKEDS